MAAPLVGSLGEISAETTLKTSLDYLDKEMTAMGWLAGIPVGIAAFAVKAFLLPRALSDGTIVSPTAGSFESAPAALILLGCILLLGASGGFLAQRVKTTTRYGHVCSTLLRGSLNKRLLIETIDWDDGFWRPYVWALRALSLGFIELTIGIALLTARQGNPNALAYLDGSFVTVWGVAVILPLVLFALYRGPIRLIRHGARQFRRALRSTGG